MASREGGGTRTCASAMCELTKKLGRTARARTAIHGQTDRWRCVIESPHSAWFLSSAATMGCDFDHGKDIDASPQGIEAKPNETHKAMLDGTQLAQRLCCCPDGLARRTERNSEPLSRLRVIALAPDREVGDDGE